MDEQRAVAVGVARGSEETAERRADPGPAPAVLVVDDEAGLRALLVYELTARGYDVAAVPDGEQALKALRSRDFQLVISDVSMPGIGGLELLERIKAEWPGLEVVLTTGFGTVDMAVEAMKVGAFDFLLKPVDLDRLASVAAHAVQAGELKSTVALQEAALAVFRSVEPKQVLDALADLTRRLLQADRAAIFLKKDGALRTAADTAGAGGDAPAAGVAEDCRQAEAGPVPERLRGGTRLVQPLTVGGRVLGFLAAFRAEEATPFSSRDARHAFLFAAQAAQAVRNAELFHELQSSQCRLIQSEKLNVAGRMAAGICHDINNPLTCILGNVQMVLDSEADRLSPQARQDLTETAAQTSLCGEIVQSMLAFVYDGAPRREVLDMAALARAVAASARRQASGAEVVVHAEPGVAALGDSVGVRQALLNLARNAVQATEGRETRLVTLRLSTDGGEAVVRVEDTGLGIPLELKDRLFEPFVTTKPLGQGTGLGLYLCRLLVERSGGRVSVGRAEGGGAAFTVRLPGAPPAARP